MRKTHLRVLVDAEMDVSQTACGLRITGKRSVSETSGDVDCSLCRAYIYEMSKRAPEPEPEAPKKKARKKKTKAPEDNAEGPVHSRRSGSTEEESADAGKST